MIKFKVIPMYVPYAFPYKLLSKNKHLRRSLKHAKRMKNYRKEQREQEQNRLKIMN